MKGTSESTAEGRVSVILPTYNRAQLLAENLKSLSRQTRHDWELVVVDDGSTDKNREVINDFRATAKQEIIYIRQENQGAGAARKRGLEEARGEFIAFMDSDDPWLPHHLDSCIAAFDSNQDIDWIVAPARVTNALTGDLIHENSFSPNGAKRPVLDLSSHSRGELNVIDDPLFVEHVISRGFPGGLQTSVLRRWIVEEVHFRPYRLFDDVAFQIESAIAGAKVGYFLDPHIIYQVHDQNVSLVNSPGTSSKKRELAYFDGISVLSELAELPQLSRHQRRLIRDRIARMEFWDLGYETYWKNGRRAAHTTTFYLGYVIPQGVSECGSP